MEKILEINNLKTMADNKEILKGLKLTINKGETHVIMGPNGAGKSTLANVILNNRAYTKTNGNIVFDGKDITNMSTDEIAKSGIFLSFQTPEEIAGISCFNFIKTAKSKIEKNIFIPDLVNEINENVEKLNMNKELVYRDLNVGFSGGEKKKTEILQMLELKPKLVILDEADSGLDVDAIKTVSKGIEMYKNNENSVLIITHSTKILQALKVDYVHILIDGKIVYTGDSSLAKQIEENGYKEFKVNVNE